MPIRIEDIVHLEEINATLAKSIDGIKTAFGELTVGFLTVIDAHNKLEAKLHSTQAQLDALIARESGRRLVALGGTAPRAWAPGRRRPITSN